MDRCEVKHLLMKKDLYRRKAKCKSCSNLWENCRELLHKMKSIIHDLYSVFKSSESDDDENIFSNTADSHIESLEDIISSITLTPEEVYHVLAALNVNKATGPDKIPAKLLKNCTSTIFSSLCNLFNKSLSMGKLLYEWKLSNIIPIPKIGPAEEVSNYRPITLFITKSYHTYPVNFTTYNSVFSKESLPPRSFCTFSMISTMS